MLIVTGNDLWKNLYSPRQLLAAATLPAGIGNMQFANKNEIKQYFFFDVAQEKRHRVHSVSLSLTMSINGFISSCHVLPPLCSLTR